MSKLVRTPIENTHKCMLNVCSVSGIFVIHHTQTHAQSLLNFLHLCHTLTNKRMLSVCSISIISVIHSHTHACSMSAPFLSSLSYTHTQTHARCLLSFCHLCRTLTHKRMLNVCSISVIHSTTHAHVFIMITKNSETCVYMCISV